MPAHGTGRCRMAVAQKGPIFVGLYFVCVCVCVCVKERVCNYRDETQSLVCILSMLTIIHSSLCHASIQNGTFLVQFRSVQMRLLVEFCFEFTFTFSHLADAFVQSDVQGREYSSYEQ